MRQFIFALSVAITIHSQFALANMICEHSMSTLSNSHLMAGLSSDKSTQVYMNLLRHLAKEKNVLSVEALAEMASQSTLPNPMHYVSDNLNGEDRYAYTKAFSSLKDVQWTSLKVQIEELVREGSKSNSNRNNARSNTRGIYHIIPLEETFPIPRDDNTAKFNGGFISSGAPFLYKDFIVPLLPWGKKEPTIYRAKDGAAVFLESEELGITYNVFTSHDGQAYVFKSKATGVTIIDPQDFKNTRNFNNAQMFLTKDEETVGPMSISMFQNPSMEIEVISQALVTTVHANAKINEVRIFTYNFSSGKSFRQTLPEGRYYIENLRGDGPVAVGIRSSDLDSEIVVSTIESSPKVLYKVSTPKDFGDYSKSHFRILETGSRHRFLAAFSETGNYVFDMSGERSLKLEPFLLIKEIDAFEELANGNLAIFAKSIDHSNLISLDFKNHQVWIEQFSLDQHYSYHENHFRLTNGDLVYVQAQRTNKVEFLRLINITEGTVKDLKAMFKSALNTNLYWYMNVSTYQFTMQGTDGRLISYFKREKLPSNFVLEPYQIYGPVDEGLHR